jgi:Fe-S oxidoreductase
LCRGEWIEWQFGPRINDAFKQIKQHLDPLNLLSPQRIIDPPKMDDTRLMRYGNDYQVIPIKTALDWSAWNVHNDPATEHTTAPGTGEDPSHGLAKAVEMCNNNGTCRKFDAGTMCPSYRVTRDEKHLTRGRANTLRLALSGQLGAEGLANPDVMETLDLCVGCKGCKRDCPTGVDMARMKIEATHHYKAHYGFTLKDKLIAYLPRYAPWAAKFASVLNLRNQFPWLAKIAESMTGLSAQRSWPTWQSDHFFSKQQSGVSKQEVLQSTKPVVLFVDTFNGFFESSNATAALGVLQAAGYSVHIASKDTSSENQVHLCCGRTFLANGMVEQAREQAQELVNALLPFAQKGIAIVGLEPSCLLTLRDEALVLGLGASAELVSQHAVLFEEFLANELKVGKLEVLKQNLKPAENDILLHGHCHQKAFGLMPSVLDVIKLIPKANPQLIESSCCGMAGSFGYEASHLDVSMQMAELSLLPAIRHQPDAIVVADGTSCRHQIADGSAREAIHVAQLLSDHLLRH